MKIKADLEAALRAGPRELRELPLQAPAVVYGAGSCGRDVARALAQRGHEVLGFIDRGAQPGATVEGRPCVPLDDVACAAWRAAGALVAVGVWNASAPADEVEHDLRARGWNDVRALPELLEPLHDSLGDRFWLVCRDFYRSPEVQERILAAFELWGDDQSRSLFVRAIESRLRGETAGINDGVREDAGPQYFPRDVAEWPAPRRFVDGGAFDGDTLASLAWDRVEAVAAFEPDAQNFLRLARWCREASSGRERAPWVVLWPCGLWSETTTLRFSDGSGASSSVSADGGTTVPVVALDDVLCGSAPDFIKLDIEGAEPDALRGALVTIRQHLPALAVCVYHRPEHLWELVLQMASWELSYKYFLRAHGANGLEWVLYAKPEALR